jgi:hypothetical protein
MTLVPYQPIPRYQPSEESQLVKIFELIINEYAILPKPHYALPIALWALATYCYDQFNAFGFLVFNAETYRCGKSRMLDILRCICHEGRVQLDISLPSICDAVQEGATILFDQAEQYAVREQSKLMINLLGSYTRGAHRTVRVGARSVSRLVYGPKVFALVGDMPLAAIERRYHYYDEEVSQSGRRDQCRAGV